MTFPEIHLPHLLAHLPGVPRLESPPLIAEQLAAYRDELERISSRRHKIFEGIDFQNRKDNPDGARLEIAEFGKGRPWALIDATQGGNYGQWDIVAGRVPLIRVIKPFEVFSPTNS